MYDLLFVRRRRRRKIAAFIALFSSIGVTSLVIVSFLGRTTGTFTVSLNNSTVRLALSEKQDFKDYSSYLRINEMAAYTEYSYDFLKDRVDILDNEETPTNIGEYTYFNPKTQQEEKGLEFLKYTFYVKNIGSKMARYTMTVNIDDRSKPTDGSNRGLDDTLRVMVFENKPGEDKHDYLVYARESAEVNYDRDGNPTRREFISAYDKRFNQETDEYPLAEKFVNDNTIAKYTVGNFGKNDIKRYTVVVWLEGNDPQSDNSEDYPEGATIKLGVDIAAYENV